MHLISLVTMLIIFATATTQAATTFGRTGRLSGNEAQLAYSYFGDQTGVVYLKAIVTEKRDPAYKYQTSFAVNGVSQNLVLSQKEQAQLFQVLRSSGIPVHTTAAGTQFIWILASITCSENSCELEDRVEMNLFAQNTAARNCQQRVESCESGEKTLSCSVSGKLHGVRICNCCTEK